MATFNYNNVTYTAIYVDPSAGSNGSGVSPSDPFNVLPTFSSIAANSAVIIRRTNTSIVLAAGQTNSNSNIIFAGSPNTTDPLYNVVPDANIWEADSYETATISLTGSSTASAMRFNGENIYVERLYLNQTSGTGNQTAGTSAMLHIASVGSTIRKVKLMVDNNEYSGTYSGNYRYGILSKCQNISISDCYIEVPNGGIYLTDGSNNINITNTTVKTWATAGVSYPIFITSGYYRIYGCKLYNKTTIGQMFYCGSAGGDATNCTFYSDYLGTNMYIWYSGSGGTATNFINCSFYARIRPGGPRYYVYSAAGYNIFKGCYFESLDDQAVSGDTICIQASSNNQFYDCIFNVDGIPFINATTASVISNCTLSGNIQTQVPYYAPSILAFKYATATYPIFCTGGATLYIGTLDLNSVPTVNRRIGLNERGKIFIDNLNVSLGTGSAYSYLNFNSNEFAAIYVKNEVNIGNWTARSLKTYMNTSNTYRSSGKNYSIKCQSFAAPTTSTLLPYLWISPLPFAGIPVMFNSTGNKKITLYFAHKLYEANGLGRNNIILEADIPDNTTPSGYTTISSTQGGSILSDNSTWNNDSGLTSMKIELPFNLTTAGEVKCRIGFFKYNASFSSGYVVVDTGIIGSDI